MTEPTVYSADLTITTQDDTICETLDNSKEEIAHQVARKLTELESGGAKIVAVQVKKKIS